MTGRTNPRRKRNDVYSADIASSREEQRMLDLAIQASLQEENNVGSGPDNFIKTESPHHNNLDHYENSSSASGSSFSRPSPAKKQKVNLKEGTAPQKINKHLAVPRSQRKFASNSNSSAHGYHPRARTDKMPEKVAQFDKLSRKQTLDWLHEVGNNTIEAYASTNKKNGEGTPNIPYASHRISEESSAVKSEFGLMLGSLGENSNTNLPSIDQVALNLGLPPAILSPSETSQNQSNDDHDSHGEGSASQINDSFDSTASGDHNLGMMVDYVDEASRKVAQQANTFLMETLIGTNSVMNNKFVEYRALKAEVEGLRSKRQNLEKILAELDSD